MSRSQYWNLNYYFQTIRSNSSSFLFAQNPLLSIFLNIKKCWRKYSGGSKNAPHILEKLGIIDEFDAIADPAKVAKGKPAPDIFIAGAEAINLDPKDCVGVEDAVAGVAAIKSAGMVAVAVGDKDELSQADEVVPSTQDFSYELFNQVWNKVNK